MKRGRYQSESAGKGRKRHRCDKGREATKETNVNKDASIKISCEDGDGDKSQPLSSCAICFEDTLKEKGSIVCGHSFCFTCIHTWSKTENTCPLCKKRFSSIDKVVMVCSGGTSSKRKRASVPSSSFKRRIPVSCRNQYTPTPSSAIPASLFQSMGVVHPLVVLTEILMPRRGNDSGHLFGVVSAEGNGSDLEWIGDGNAQVQGLGFQNVSFGGHQELGTMMEIGSGLLSRRGYSLAPFLMVRNATHVYPPAGTSASNAVEIDLTRSESGAPPMSIATIRQRRILQRSSSGAPPIRRASGGNPRQRLNSMRVPRLRSPPP